MQKNSLVIMLGSRIVIDWIASLLPGGWGVGFFDFVLLDSAPVFFPKNTFLREENNKLMKVLNAPGFVFQNLNFERCTQI